MGTGVTVNRDWEATFTSWGQPPSQTERDKCENAERAIRKAIAASTELADHSIEVFAQGSYANRTNVRQSSDVDICVLCTDVCFSKLEEGLTDNEVGLDPAYYTYSQFKNDVQTALIDFFGPTSVTRGNKAFDVHANTYRVDADAVPCFEHRWFYRYDGEIVEQQGTELRPDSGRNVINWPRQNYSNGVSKNLATGKRFKPVVRILKRLRNEMVGKNIVAAKSACSFLIECLVWNVPDEEFGGFTCFGEIENVLAHLWNNTRTDAECHDWTEVNDIKYLFRPGQPWTRQQANDFLQAAWDYIGLEQ